MPRPDPNGAVEIRFRIPSIFASLLEQIDTNRSIHQQAKELMERGFRQVMCEQYGRTCLSRFLHGSDVAPCIKYILERVDFKV